MANTLTNLLPTLYQALDIVSREMVGFIPAVTRNSSAERAAINETIRFPIAPASSAVSISPGLYAPDAGDQTFTTATLAITSSKAVPVRWNGEEMKGTGNTGQLQQMMRDQFAQAMRTLVNEVEADLGGLAIYASRAYGSGGTTPFNTAADFTEFAGVQKILDDNGCPTGDRHLVMNSAAMANIRGKQSLLFKVNEAGTAELLRQGTVGRVEGLDLHVSSQVLSHTKGTGASYIVNGTTFAAGSTTISLDTGTGTVLAGDILVNTADSNKYVVLTGITGAGDVVIAKPGLQVALADNLAVTVGTSYAGNLCFHRSAIQLLTRAPAMPEGGDMADDVTEIQDPVSGLAFQVALYRQYRQIKYEIGLAWGCACVKPEHMAILQG